MTQITTLPANAAAEDIISVLQAEGAAILSDVLGAADVDRVLAQTRPYIEATGNGRDAFSGHLTTRTGALVARSPACRELILNPTVLHAAREFLAPYCARIQLHLSQIIRLKPGQAAQPLHRDRWAWGTHLQNVEPQFNTIWALTDFTEENGATRVVPGSTRWPDDRRPVEEEVTQALMPAGSVLLYTGSVFHGGGANRSNRDRIGVNLTYTLAWLRQEENQYLSCPPEIARTLPRELQDLLGYTLGSYALGYYTPPLPPGAGPESVGPEYALGVASQSERLGEQALLEHLVRATTAAKLPR